jgi:hypothetical protein
MDRRTIALTERRSLALSFARPAIKSSSIGYDFNGLFRFGAGVTIA